jgi:hypothetical protein
MIMDDLHKYAHTDSVLDTEYQAYYNAMGGYFNSLVKSDSSQFWTEAAPYLEQFNTTMPATKLLELHAVAAMLYAPLLSSGRIDEAKKIHDVMQTGLKAANKLDMAQVDEVSFRDSFSTSSLDAFLSLYKKAVAGHDEANAKKWLALLNMIAPESPQASAARKIERERQQPKAN